MVEKWRKNYNKISKNFSNIDFEEILVDIENKNYSKYDIKSLSWYKNILRIRIWDYRAIIREWVEDDKIILFWKRWDVYKSLKNLNI